MNYKQLIQQKKLKFQETIPNDLMCLLCHNVLVDPYTVPCGHDYCISCLREHINNNNNPHCIGSDDDCKEVILDLSTNVSKSFKAIKKIKQVKVHCLNTNCTEIMEIKNLEKHLETCDFQNIYCPYVVVGCNKTEINREQLKHHLMDKNIDHANIVTKYVEEINNKNEQMKNEIDRLKENMEQQLENELEMVKKDLVNKNVMIRNLEEELKEVKEELNRSKNGSERNTNIINNSISEFKNEIKQLETKLNNENREIKKAKDEFRKETKLNNELKKANEELRKEMWNLKEESKVNENKLEKEIVQLQKLTQNRVKTSFEWIIEDFVTKYEAAANYTDIHIESEPQYLCGYNIVLLLYPRRKWCSDYWVYVRFKFVPGIYDEEIYWPCTRDISLSLVTWDKDELCGTEDVINKGGDLYQKPIGNGNNLSGFYLLCQCTNILNQTFHLISEDKIKIKMWMK